MVYAPKRSKNSKLRFVQDVDLSTDEVIERDALSAEFDIYVTAEQQTRDYTALAINYLKNQDYVAGINVVNNSLTLTAEEKVLWRNIIKGQAAIVQILRQIGRNIDISGV